MREVGISILLHDELHAAPTGHPESAERLRAAADMLRADATCVGLPVVVHGLEPFEKIHRPHLLARLRSMSAQGGGGYDPDTYVTSGSFDAAVAAGDALLTAVDAAFGDGPTWSLVIARPPGHHAESSRAMGFCLLNQVAAAAQYALDRGFARRVAIVDFDVHHGNGTQEIFYDRRDVLFVSSHQYPFYPGTGAREEVGTGEGKGFTRNYPLAAGADGASACALYKAEIVPAIVEFRPDIVIVSAGFDAHRNDPLGGLRFTDRTYHELGAMLGSCADRVVSYVEGGYDPQANRDSISAYLKGLQQL